MRVEPEDAQPRTDSVVEVAGPGPVGRNARADLVACRTWARPGREELTTTEIGAVLGRLDQLCWLDLTGGEPFVRSDLGEVFAAVADAVPGLAVLHFQTNGWCVDRVVEHTQCLRVRLDAGAELIVTVSIDGPPEVHDAICGRAGSDARAVETARRRREIAGVDVHVGTTLTQRNCEAVEQTGLALTADIPGLSRARWHFNAMQISAHFYHMVPVAGRIAGAGDLDRTRPDAREVAAVDDSTASGCLGDGLGGRGRQPTVPRLVEPPGKSIPRSDDRSVVGGMSFIHQRLGRSTPASAGAES